MALLVITPEDLTPFDPDIPTDKAEAMIADIVSRARRFAPCLGDDIPQDVADAAKGILRDVILRWNDAGSGTVVSRTHSTGPFQGTESYDTQRPKPRFWPSEIKELQDLCRTVTTESGAFHIDQVQTTAPVSAWVTLEDGTIANLYMRPDLWAEYGTPPPLW